MPANSALLYLLRKTIASLLSWASPRMAAIHTLDVNGNVAGWFFQENERPNFPYASAW
jgi:hypothetical protein